MPVSVSNITEERTIRVGITGASTSDPTRRAGPGVTVTRTSQGLIKFTFASNPGTFVQIGGATLRADTPSGVKGYSISGDTYTPPSGSVKGNIEVAIWDASNNAVDLTSVQYLDISFIFSTQSRIT